MDLESQYERYDLSLAAIAEGAQDQFDPVDNADEFHIATFFPGVPIQGLMHYPPVVDFAQVSSVQRRLKKMIQRGSALEDLVAVALVLLRHMHAYDMSEESWAEYKSFVRQEDARFNAASQAAGRARSNRRPDRVASSMGCVPVRPRPDETEAEYAAVWVMRLSKKSDSAFYKTFNIFSGLVEDIAQFASARLNAPRLHYAVVRDLVVTLARPRFTEEVMAQTFAPIDRNAGYAHTASRSPTPESTRHRSRSRDRGQRMRGFSSARSRSRGRSAPRQQQRRSASRRHDDQGNPPQGQVEPSDQGVPVPAPAPVAAPAAVIAPLRDDPRVARLERKIEDLNFQ
ncbi:unnamed protein product, partial [Aphanomyces euteiches]